MKKAIVIGGSGMIGTQLIKQLIEGEEYSEVISLVRRSSGIINSKLKEYIIDFDQPESWKNLVSGDTLFSTLGTTIANAKTKDAQFKVDFTYQYNVAEIAAQNSVPSYVLISSAGANSKSKAFYLSTKGKLEDKVKQLSFNTVSILQPGQLDGDRKENRTAERISLSIMYAFNKIGLFRKYRPIQASLVAKAMINASNKKISGVYKLDEVFLLAE
jgi:NAD dependent epimerase/dehydratase family.